MLDTQWLQFGMTAIVFLAAVAAAAVYIRSSVAKSLHVETTNLAETRGKTIDDLHDKLEAMSKEITELRALLAATNKLQSDIIAKEVVHQLKAVLTTDVADVIVKKMKTPFSHPDGTPV